MTVTVGVVRTWQRKPVLTCHFTWQQAAHDHVDYRRYFSKGTAESRIYWPLAAPFPSKPRAEKQKIYIYIASIQIGFEKRHWFHFGSVKSMRGGNRISAAEHNSRKA